MGAFDDIWRSAVRAIFEDVVTPDAYAKEISNLQSQFLLLLDPVTLNVKHSPKLGPDVIDQWAPFAWLQPTDESDGILREIRLKRQ